MPKRTLKLTNLLKSIPFKPETVELEGTYFPYMRVEIPIPTLNPLEWLEAQSLYPKVYFESPKDGQQIAGIGEAIATDKIPKFGTKGPSPRFFGGIDFYERQSSNWKNFPSCRFFLPLIEIEIRKGMTYFCLNKVSEALPKEINLKTVPFTFLSEKPKERQDLPSYPNWKKHVQDCLQSAQKVVLARSSRFSFDCPLSPLGICHSLRGKSKTATVFTYQFSPEQAFVGATPESLYRRRGRNIETAAVAGTRPRGKTKAEDLLLQKELISHKKETHEIQLVKDEIARNLSPLCKTLQHQDHNRIIQTSTVQHLYSDFEGVLKDDIDDATLISALHPTPALGGYPKEKAKREILAREKFDRGWYGAPVGWISNEAAHLLVAIRSALVKKNEMFLFSGAGIVKGSNPKDEWKELEHKISQFQQSWYT